MTKLRHLLLLLATGCLSYHAGTLPDAPEDATYLTLRGTRVHYVDEGPQDAPAVVLVHGFASSVGVWSEVREALRETHRVLALDLKGFGYSGRPEGDYSPEEQARLVLALMDARSVHSASFVAHSYGSSVTLKIALLAPERVERIALYDAWVYAEQLPTSFHWARGRGVGEAIFGAFYNQRIEDKVALGFFDPEVIPQALVDNVEAQVSRPGTNAAALAAVRAMRYEDQQSRYGEIAQPVLLLWGREDTVTPLTFGERLVNELPNGRLEVYPRCGHFPMIEARRPSTRDLVGFLEGASAASDPVPVPMPVPMPMRESEETNVDRADDDTDAADAIQEGTPW
ncbi:MAG: alpha/beta fold hydrolase [Myxococcota bacterium]